MALRIRGRDNFYHVYFRAVVSNGDGTYSRVLRTVNLGTTDLVTAKAMEAEIMAKAKAARLHQRAIAHLARLDAESGVINRSDADKAIPSVNHRKRRLRICDALEAAAKYRPVADTARKLFSQFVKFCSGIVYMDQVTPDLVFDFLDQKKKGKTFNNYKAAINSIFERTLLESGLNESPLARIPNRVNDSDHQRPFTEDEFIRIFNNAPDPWKSASLIAWFTGLREKDVFLLRWDMIRDGCIVTTPNKTSRFRRSVRIPIHRQLQEYLDSIPKGNDGRILGAWPYSPRSGFFQTEFSRILSSLKIQDSDDGIVNFNSFRNSFITRCDQFGIPRHATRGIVGHVKDDTTDLYSHDIESARQILRLPELPLA